MGTIRRAAGSAGFLFRYKESPERISGSNGFLCKSSVCPHRHIVNRPLDGVPIAPLRKAMERQGR
jgi:hypothetical protein